MSDTQPTKPEVTTDPPAPMTPQPGDPNPADLQQDPSGLRDDDN